MITKYYIDDSKIVKVPKNISCIGYFDGVHIGHQALISKTVKLAKKNNVEPFLITFYPDPQDVISTSKTKHINSFNKRIKLFEKYGIKGVIIINFNRETMSLSKEVFINKYLNRLNIQGLVCGFDFHFGYKGEGDYKSLAKLVDYKVYKVDEVTYYGKKVSSTRIKEEINKGNLKLVNKLLGYPYQK